MSDIQAALLQLYINLMTRAMALDEDGFSDVAEDLRDQADLCIDRYAQLRRSVKAT